MDFTGEIISGLRGEIREDYAIKSIFALLYYWEIAITKGLNPQLRQLYSKFACQVQFW